MAGEDESNRYNAQEMSIRYGTIWTNGLFDTDRGSLKFTRMGRSIHIPYTTIFWGFAGFVFGFGLPYLILGKILHVGTAYNMVISLGFAVVATVGFIRLGNWSPLQKSTGEDLITWALMSLRENVSTGGVIVRKKPAEVKLFSLAVGSEGEVVKCREWIGTRPIYQTPPKSLYEHKEVYKTPLLIPPRGEFQIIPADNYNDGVIDDDC